MNKSIKSTAVSCIDDNKANAILMAKVEAGKTVILQVKARLKSVVPGMLHGFIDSKYSGLVIANVFTFAQKFYLPGNEKAVLLADCVMKSSMFELGAGFDIPKMANDYINGVFSKVDLSKFGIGDKAE
jgi:hypothetical protein